MMITDKRSEEAHTLPCRTSLSSLSIDFISLEGESLPYHFFHLRHSHVFFLFTSTFISAACKHGSHNIPHSNAAMCYIFHRLLMDQVNQSLPLESCHIDEKSSSVKAFLSSSVSYFSCSKQDSRKDLREVVATSNP